MRIFILLTLVVLFTFCMSSCSSVDSFTLKLTEQTVILSIDKSLTYDQSLFHVYFHDSNNKNSFGIITDTSADRVLLMPGHYSVYAYQLGKKSSKSYAVHSASYIENFDVVCGKPIELSLTMNDVLPRIYLYTDHETYKLEIEEPQPPGLFTLSSLSVKQADGRIRSQKALFDELSGRYVCEITYEKCGDWFLNLSFTMKGKRDNTLLDYHDISVSTTSFKGIYLGFIENKCKIY